MTDTKHEPRRLASYLDDCLDLALDDFIASHGAAFLLHEGRRDGGGAPDEDATEFERNTISQSRGRGGLQDEPTFDFAVLPLRPSGRSTYSGFISIGRGAGSDVVLTDGTVSTFHAFVTRRDGGFRIQDGGSKNGTFVDDERAPPKDARDGIALVPGATVRLGSVELMFLDAEGLCKLVQRVARRR
jgi:pSer/pThr/pTyr-binding forkhead associated (FHA) protein